MPFYKVQSDAIAGGSMSSRFSSNRSSDPTLLEKKQLLLSSSTVDTLSIAATKGDNVPLAVKVLTPQESRDKQEAIEDCLRGSDDGLDDAASESLDLWQLRELAVTNGGLLDPILRKRAWPILTQALRHMSSPRNDDTTITVLEPVAPSPNDMLMLQREVRCAAWNVQKNYHAQRVHKRPTEVDPETDERRVTFSSIPTIPEAMDTNQPTVLLDLSNLLQDNSPTSVIDTAGVSFKYDRCDASVRSASSRGSTLSGRSSKSRRGRRYRKAGSQEQKILTNVITSCLRIPPIESEAFEDDRFRYYSGLHDLTALIMVNVESPSLCSLIL
jgi:hypothetical protein